MQVELRDIKFKDFQRFLVDGDTSVCGGEENAKRFYDEYIEHTASPIFKRSIVVNNNIIYYALKINVIDTILSAIQAQYSVELANILKEDLEFNRYELSEETYLDDISKIVIECTRYKLKIKEWEQEKEAIEKANVINDKKLDYSYFEDVLIAISEMEKVFISDDISTLRYCRLYKKLVDNIEKQKVNGTTRGK